MKLLYPLILILSIGCESKPKLTIEDLDIDVNCSLKVSGTMECTFTNNSSIKGRVCLNNIRVERYLNDELPKWNTYGYVKDCGEGTKIISKDSFCSGVLEPLDTKDRTQRIDFDFSHTAECYDLITFGWLAGTTKEGWYEGLKFTYDKKYDLVEQLPK